MKTASTATVARDTASAAAAAALARKGGAPARPAPTVSIGVPRRFLAPSQSSVKSNLVLCLRVLSRMNRGLLRAFFGSACDHITHKELLVGPAGLPGPEGTPPV